jgi:hypothetical protein
MREVIQKRRNTKQTVCLVCQREFRGPDPVTVLRRFDRHVRNNTNCAALYQPTAMPPVEEQKP